MRALLDTNALLWWLGEPTRIPRETLETLQASEAVVLYSQVSLLEIQIKIGLGKLTLGFSVSEIPRLAESSGLTFHPLQNAAIFTLPKLPAVHRDPFDRLLICEAIQEGIPLVTPDETIHRYPVRIMW